MMSNCGCRLTTSMRRLCSCFEASIIHRSKYSASNSSRCFNAALTRRSYSIFSKVNPSPTTSIHCNTATTKSPMRFLQTSSCLSQKDYYKTLGVKKGDSAGAIKKAYYELAKKYHPDTNREAGAAERFQAIQEAYEVLSDQEKRAAYDQFGSTDFTGGGHGGRGGRGGGDPFDNINVDDIFKQFFGEHARQGGAGGAGFSAFEGFQNEMRRSQNFMLNLSFMDAVQGGPKDVRVQVPTSCKRCSGSKSEPGTQMKRCPACNGTGEQTTTTGFFNMRSTCSRCRGQGTFISDPCRGCRGKGTVMETQTITVDVPAGIEDAQTVRVPVDFGELFITFKVEESKIFKRNGADVQSDVHIGFAQAILGGNITTKGLYNDIDLLIKPGTQSHQQMRLIGKGIPRLNGYGKGDHLLNIKIKLPRHMTARQKELIEEFAELDNTISGTVHGVVRGRVRADEKDNSTSKQNTKAENNNKDENSKRSNASSTSSETETEKEGDGEEKGNTVEEGIKRIIGQLNKKDPLTYCITIFSVSLIGAIAIVCIRDVMDR